MEEETRVLIANLESETDFTIYVTLHLFQLLQRIVALVLCFKSLNSH